MFTVRIPVFTEQNYRRTGYPPSVTNRWTMLGVIFLTRLSMGIQFQSIASVAPLLISDLHIGYGQVGWLMGLFMLPGAAIAYPGGMLGRRFGERRLVLLGLALMTLGGLTTAVSDGFAARRGGARRERHGRRAAQRHAHQDGGGLVRGPASSPPR